MRREKAQPASPGALAEAPMQPRAAMWRGKRRGSLALRCTCQVRSHQGLTGAEFFAPPPPPSVGELI